MSKEQRKRLTKTELLYSPLNYSLVFYKYSVNLLGMRNEQVRKYECDCACHYPGSDTNETRIRCDCKSQSERGPNASQPGICSQCNEAGPVREVEGDLMCATCQFAYEEAAK